jgi:hypothetical protein
MLNTQATDDHVRLNESPSLAICPGAIRQPASQRHSVVAETMAAKEHQDSGYLQSYPKLYQSGVNPDCLNYAGVSTLKRM